MASEEDLQETDRVVLGSAILVTAVGLMVICFLYADGVNGNTLAGQMLVFAVGIAIFFFQLALFTVPAT